MHASAPNPSTRPRLLLVLAARRLRDSSPVLELLLQELIHGEGDGLAGGHTHDAGRDALVEGVEALLLEHVARDVGDSAPGGVAGVGGGLLETRLDGVDGRVGERAHGAGNEADQRRLVRRELRVSVLRLPALKDGLEFGVGGEVDGLVGTWVRELASVMLYAGNRSTGIAIT